MDNITLNVNSENFSGFLYERSEASLGQATFQIPWNTSIYRQQRAAKFDECGMFI